MTGYEILLLLCGAAFLIASYFLGNHKGELLEIDTSEEIKKIKEAAVYQENEVRQNVQRLLEDVKNDTLEHAEDMLGRVANEKIMAVDEFSNQVLEKIENNNQEVIFLYDMLQKKEEEMKLTMQKMEQTRRENKELFDRLEELKKAKARVNSRNAAQAAVKQSAHTADGMDVNRTPKSQAEGVPASKTEKLQDQPDEAHSADLISESEAEQEAEEGISTKERRDRVLAMSAEHKSIREISKELSMGQGEVKLIIDLYGNKKA